MKEVLVNAYDEYDFCSKWVLDGKCWRDYSKILTTKMYYNKSNQIILNNPGIHAMAIYSGVKSEKASRLIEQICLQRVKNCQYKETNRSK